MSSLWGRVLSSAKRIADVTLKQGAETQALRSAADRHSGTQARDRLQWMIQSQRERGTDAPTSPTLQTPLSTQDTMATEPTITEESSQTDLRALRGIGLVYEQKLRLHHIYTVEQLSALSNDMCVEIKPSIRNIQALRSRAQSHINHHSPQ